MSTFNGLMSEIEGISVDQFEGKNLKSRAYFLSHCHSDHMKGIDSKVFYNHLLWNGYSIYASEISSIVLKNRWGDLNNHIKALSVGETHTILVPKCANVEETFLSVTLIPAGHCPGSVMFLFNTAEKTNIMYTGDFRLNPEDLPKLKQFHCRDGEPITIDKMYFDSTFFNRIYSYFPSRENSSAVICGIIKEWISKGNDHVVNVNIPAYYGSEFLYMDISRQLGMPFHVHKRVYNSYRQIAEMEGVFTENSRSTQIHSCTPLGGCKTKEIMCRTKNNLKIRQIIPSALRWKMLTDSMPIHNEQSENFYVCYSSHCSFRELKGFIKYLKPKSIEPCVVPYNQSDKFYDSINTNFKEFLNIPCRLSESAPKNNIQESNINYSSEDTESSPIKMNSDNIVYPDSDEEPPKKSSRLMAIQNKMFS